MLCMAAEENRGDLLLLLLLPVWQCMYIQLHAGLLARYTGTCGPPSPGRGEADGLMMCDDDDDGRRAHTGPAYYCTLRSVCLSVVCLSVCLPCTYVSSPVRGI